MEIPQLFLNMIGTICVWKLKERIEQDRRNSLIKRWHWKCSQTDTWFSSKNFLNNFKLLYFFHIFNRKFQNVSEKHLFFHFLLQFSTPILPRKPHPILFLLLKSSKIAGNIYFIWEICVFMTMSWRKCYKTIRNSYFWLKNDLYSVQK